MAICTYCGQSAGWFRHVHPACVRRAADGTQALETTTAKALVAGKCYLDVKPELEKLIAQARIPHADAWTAIKAGWNSGAARKSIERPISRDQFDAMETFYRDAGLERQVPDPYARGKTCSDFSSNPAWRQMWRSEVLWNLLHDTILFPEDGHDFNLQAGEIGVYYIFDVLLKEVRTQTSWQGGYTGFTVPIGNLFYYTLGSMQGHAVQRTGVADIAAGQALITTEHIYFSAIPLACYAAGLEGGSTTNFRIPYSQIVRFQPYSDAIGICTNYGQEQIFADTSSKPECPDGWFLFNLVQTLAAKAGSTSWAGAPGSRRVFRR